MSHQFVAFVKIDHALAKYYQTCGRDDYLDKNGMGKLLRYVIENGFITDELSINLELGDNCLPNGCSYLRFDGNKFPIPDYIFIPPQNVPAFTFYIIQYCYKYEQSPNVEYIQQILSIVDGVDLRCYEQSVSWILGVSIGWIFINWLHFHFLMEDDDESEFDIIEFEDGELLSVQSDWEE
eukprot:CAMPEP_0201577498 /NCGR_PEP_ID=MMETSP0190_2-20130828/23921_1 /ASSEMBLY_ACC=CAM_ASM_000263 /TAXON_ID=37353 /ORGANISM="Rosalina sp." /LENGTH=179 /DNA_ID=CAMNT_0048009601 /DNA_START=33 /DNA_END=572 /DNA_ORIENTATION=+